MTAENYLNNEIGDAHQTYDDVGITILSGIEHSEMCRIMDEYHEHKLKLLGICFNVSNSLPSWYKKLDLLSMQLEALQEDIPKNLKLRSNAKLDLELIDMRLTAMRSKLKQAIEELKGNDY